MAKKKAKPGQDYYPATEAAQLLGLKSARVRQMCASGQIECFKVGLTWVIPAAAIEAARSRKTKPGPAAKEAA